MRATISFHSFLNRARLEGSIVAFTVFETTLRVYYPLYACHPSHFRPNLLNFFVSTLDAGDEGREIEKIRGTKTNDPF